MEFNGAPELLCFPHSSEYLPLCSAEQRNSYRFGTTWGWVNDDRIFIFGWTIPLRHALLDVALCVCLNQVMQSHGVHNLVFSSSATVYGDPQKLPIDEQHPVGGCTNPYGKTKYFIEEMIRDQCTAEKVADCSLMTLLTLCGRFVTDKMSCRTGMLCCSGTSIPLVLTSQDRLVKIHRESQTTFCLMLPR